MQDRKMIAWSAVGYAVLWTVLMIICTGARDVPAIGIWIVCGVVNGLLWYWLFDRGTRWLLGRRDRMHPKS
jgi:hypothetical protein